MKYFKPPNVSVLNSFSTEIGVKILFSKPSILSYNLSWSKTTLCLAQRTSSIKNIFIGKVRHRQKISAGNLKPTLKQNLKPTKEIFR